MNEIYRKRFLLKQTDGSQYRIYAKNNGISILMADSNGRWSETAHLTSMHPCFYANIDSRDVIHIISQDLGGSVIYSKTDGGKLVSSKVLVSTPANVFDRSFFMLFRNTGPIFFYTIRKQSETMLVGQYISGKKAVTPVPLLKVPEGVSPYWITRLWQNAGLILFPEVSGLYTQICAGIIHLDSLKITSRKIITTDEANCESPKCIILSDGTIHMLYSVRKNGRFYLKYQKGEATSLDFSKSETIAVSRQSFTKYNMEYSYNTLNINWLENGYIYFSTKKTGDIAFSKIQPYKSYRLRYLEYYHCKSNEKNRTPLSYSTEQLISLEGKTMYAFYRESENIPGKEEKRPEAEEPATASPEAAIFRALADYVATRNDISQAQLDNIQRIGNIIIELSKFVSLSRQKTSPDERDMKSEKAAHKKCYSLIKPAGKHFYKILK